MKDYKIKLFTVYGSPLYLKLSFLLLPLILIFSDWNSDWTMYDIASDLVFTISIFTAIMIHELGHVRVAKKLGYKTNRIFISLLGGGAEVDPKFTQNDKHHFRVALAGPLTNIMFSVLMIVTMVIALISKVDNLMFYNIIVANMVINLILGIFNLLPIVPMDGSRMLKSNLNMTINKNNKKRSDKIVGVISLLFSLGLLITSFMMGDLILGVLSVFFVGLSILEITNHKYKSNV